MKWVRRLLWAALLVAGVAAFAAHRVRRDEMSSLEGALGQVPAFALKDQSGRTVTERDYAGKVWIANFVFTRCASVCPMLTAKFRALQTDLKDVTGLAYVSISVDPEYDTPEVLAAYAKRFEADISRWRFLTGPLGDIERTVVQGFKIHVGDRKPSAEDPTLMEIMHGEHFVLIDASGTIRGYFQADEAGLKELEAAAREAERAAKAPRR